MPRKNIKSKTRDSLLKLNDARLSYLMHGQDLFGECHLIGFPESDLKQWKKLWDLHEHCIMHMWREDKAHEKKRPWGWWVFDQGMEPPGNEKEYLEKNNLLEGGELNE